MLQAHELYIATSSLYNYIDTKKLLLSAYHPTVETVGFPGLHFVKTKSVFSEQADQMLYQVRRFGQKNGRCLQHDPG